MSAAPSGARVERRQVFFFSGFDPKGAAYYHRLYQEGARAQQAARGDRYRVGPRERTDERLAQRWQVECRPAGAASDDPVFTDFEFLAWDDLVRAQWPKGVLGVGIGSVLAYVAALSSGWALVRVWRQTPRTLVALAYPAIYWLLALLGGLALGGGLVGLLARAGAPAAVQVPAAALGVLALWGAALAVERRLHTSWLLRIYRFADHWARGRLPALEQRLDTMAERVWRSLQADDSDEVLLVGYSVGSMLAVSVLARVLQRCRREGDAQAYVRAQQRLSLLTLGQCVPLLGLMPRAQAFRSELAVLAGATAVRWTDFSAPGDWGSFALVDPLRICRVAPPGMPVLVPQMRSPRFHTLFPADDYAVLRRNKRRLHLQYLMAAPLAGDYDYFLLTAGPERLGGPQPQTPSP
ncbi:MAG: hypothetical protein JNM97_01225 [Rhodoferax sp.]|nr:hypothetical protein [Rhodoferax sp.]